MKIDWREKFGNMKFWTSLIAYLTSLLAAFHVAEETSHQIILIVTGIATLIVYLLVEGATERAKIINQTPPDQKPPDDNQ